MLYLFTSTAYILNSKKRFLSSVYLMISTHLQRILIVMGNIIQNIFLIIQKFSLLMHRLCRQTVTALDDITIKQFYNFKSLSFTRQLTIIAGRPLSILNCISQTFEIQ